MDITGPPLAKVWCHKCLWYTKLKLPAFEATKSRAGKGASRSQLKGTRASVNRDSSLRVVVFMEASECQLVCGCYLESSPDGSRCGW